MSTHRFIRRLSAGRSRRGQALVETALLLPLLLILLLGAIDFGRVFFGWVTLHQAARIGANYAGMHPNMSDAEKDSYLDLIDRDVRAITCEVEEPPDPTYRTPAGTETTDPKLGDHAEVTLTCDFAMITPLAGVFFGDPLTMRATSSFPVRSGCVNCPSPAPPPTPPLAPDLCRLVPSMEELSVAGARAAWKSAGFLESNFTPEIGQDTETVDFAVVTDDPDSDCDSTRAYFASTVTVTTKAAETCGAGETTAPNLAGTTVGEARVVWEVTFSGDFQADEVGDDRVVVNQETDPPAEPGGPGVSCIPTTAGVEVVTGPPWPEPPAAPCEVPGLIDHKKNDAQGLWAAADFTTDVQYVGDENKNWKIKAQSLVGGDLHSCDVSIIVYEEP